MNFAVNIRVILLSIGAIFFFNTRPSYAQQATPSRFSVTIKSTTLDGALQEIGRAGVVRFTYNPADAKKISIIPTSFRQETIERILQQLLKNTDYTFTRNGNAVLVFRQEAKPAEAHRSKERIAKTAVNTDVQNVSPVTLNGQVTDEKNKPIEFANIEISETGIRVTTNADGIFTTRVPASVSRIHLTATFVGKQTIEKIIDSVPDAGMITFVMKDLSLSLDGIQVTATQKGKNSNSSIVFDREAIEQSQAFSMADILNNLPGKEIKAPDLHDVQNLTLRTAATGTAANNNSMGVAIIVDDILQSNNANMQNKSIAMFGGTSTISQAGRGSYDVPFTGLDLRDIPVTNIEKIEVISGVASAKYGEITNGAVLVERQAGKSPYQFSVGIGGYSTQYSLSKGLSLGKNRGALNLSLNYLRSNENPTNSFQTYGRTNLGAMWTNYLTKNIKNTVSVSYNFRNDNIKEDPEDNRGKKTFVKNHDLSITNRTSIFIKRKYLDNITLSLGYNRGRQESYTQYLMNGASKGIGDKDTTGIYEGYFIPGIYTAVDHIVGKPENFNGNLSFNGNLNTGDLIHRLSAGANIYVAANNGEGVIVDPNTPRFTNQRYQNQRPYGFEALPAIVNTGFFLQDNVDIKIGTHLLNLSPGLRYDLQNGFGTLQPRVNTAFRINKTWQMTLGYGTSTKAPPMTYRYPAPVYFDIPLLQVYDVNAAKSLYLVYTQKETPDNSYLKPMKSNQLEWGLKYNNPFIQSSLFIYYKHNSNGFVTRSDLRYFVLPVYDYKTENDKIVYWQTDSLSLRTGLSTNKVYNGYTSDDAGAEWYISTSKIKAIQTSFSLVSSFSYSKYGSSMPITAEASTDAMTLYNIWYGTYAPLNYKNWAITSKLTATTHIPKLGFIVNVAADFFWAKRQESLSHPGIPTGYADLQANYYPITKYDPENSIHRALLRNDDAASEGSEPFYWNMHLQIAKEIKNKIRFSVRAYNVLNLLSRDYNATTGSVRTFTSPVSLSGEISFKF